MSTESNGSRPSTPKQISQIPNVSAFSQEEGPRKDLMLINLSLREINPVSCGQHHCNPGHRFGPTIRFYYLLHYVVSGYGYFHVGTHRYTLRPGNLFIIGPEQVALYEASEENPWYYQWIGFTSEMDLSGILMKDVYDLPECGYLFKLMTDAGDFGFGKEYYLCAKIYEMLALLVRYNTPNGEKHGYIEIAKNFIATNYNDPRLSISQIAEILNLNRSYFSVLFRQVTGESPQAYLTNYRLIKAAEMLAMKVLKVNEVGRACGYSDPYHFSKAFKNKFSVSPSHYAGHEHEMIAKK